MSRGRAQDLPVRLEALASAAALAQGRLDESAVEVANVIVAKANQRMRHGTVHTLVALLGATGSGKSSIANAVVGSDVATTGVRRPTTSTTLACVWGDDDAQPLLDWLGVKARHQVSGDEDLAGLVLLDVPDHDSVEVEHRLEMEWIAAHADMLVWITDPQKYADAVLHRYLRDLSGHGAVMVITLNKVDTLSGSEVTACRKDLARLLSDDGIGSAKVIEISATTGDGVADLRKVLAKGVHDQKLAVERLTADVALAAEELKAAAGPEAKPEKTKGKGLATELAEASGLQVVTDAVKAGHMRDASAATGWPVTRWVRNLRPHPLRKLHLGSGSGGRSSLPAPSGAQRARVAAAVRDVADSASQGLPPPWPSLVRAAAVGNPKVLEDRIDQAVSDATRQHHSKEPLWWKAAGFLQVLLAVAAVVGLIWLAALFVAEWLQLPEVPVPKWGGTPYPTALTIGGLGLGWLLGLFFRQLARIGANGRSRAIRRQASRSVEELADELVLKPIRVELESRNQIHQLLKTAGAK